MSSYVPHYKEGGVWHPLNIIDISTSDEEVEDVIITIETSEEEVEEMEKVLYITVLNNTVIYCSVLYNTVIYCSVLYDKVQVVGGIIDISTSSDEEEEVDLVDVVEEVVKEVVMEEVVKVASKKRVDFTITLHQQCNWNDGSGRKVVVRTTYFYYK